MEIKLPIRSKINQATQETSQITNQPSELQQKNRLQSAIMRQKLINQKQSGQQSPLSIRLGKTSSKILEQPLSTIQQIGATQTQINYLIDELDFKLQSNYHHKQAKLMQAYREELIRGHKELMDLKNINNEQQIKNEMNEKFLQLKKQRLELIQVNMFYSNKCQEYKQLLDTKISEGYELQREIKFLEKQINNSNQKKIQLMSEVYEKNSPLKLHPKDDSNNDTHRIISLQNIKFDASNQNEHANLQTPNKKISLSTHANSEVIKKMGLTSNIRDKIKIHPNQVPQITSQVKKLFNEKLSVNQNFYTDRSIAKSGTILTKLSALQNQNSELKKQTSKGPSQIESLFIKTVNEIKEKKSSKKQITLFKGEQFTDFEKKQIMKAFLSKEEVKQYIYNIIFDKADDCILFRKKAFKEKFKIVASDKKETQEE